MIEEYKGVKNKSKKSALVYVLIFCGFYLALKLWVNPDPLIIVNQSGIHLGLFNYTNRSVNPDTAALFSIMPLELIDPYQTSLTGGHPLSWWSREAEGRTIHVMGTDHLGRDLFAGWISGLEIALLIGLLTAILSGFFSTLLACISTYGGRFKIKVSSIYYLILFLLGIISILFLAWWIIGIYPSFYFVFFLVIFLCFLFWILSNKGLAKGGLTLRPDKWNSLLYGFFQPIPDIILLAILTISLQGNSIWGIILILTLFRIPGGAWYLQGVGIPIMQQEYIMQARTMGLGIWRIIRYHLLPAMMPQVMLFMSLTAGRAVIAESVLSFLGIGPTSGLVTWGNLISLGLTDYRYIGVALMSLIGLVFIQWIFKRILLS